MLIPHKITRITPLTHEQCQDNFVLAHTQNYVEHGTRCLKIFRMLKETYRHLRRRCVMQVHLRATLCNFASGRST